MLAALLHPRVCAALVVAALVWSLAAPHCAEALLAPRPDGVSGPADCCDPTPSSSHDCDAACACPCSQAPGFAAVPGVDPVLSASPIFTPGCLSPDSLATAPPGPIPISL